MPHVSVMIPAYNRAHLVDKTIDSLLGQTHRDFTVTVIDDASTDDTREVVGAYCREYPGRVRLISNEDNLGLTRNWNRCVACAKGPLIQLVLSDDLIDSTYLEVAAAAFDRYANLGLVAASCRYIDGRGRVIDPGRERPPGLYAAGDEAVQALMTGGHPHVSSLVTHKRCYDALGAFREDIWSGPDVEMDTRIASRFSYHHVGAVCTSFRRHGSNMGNIEYLRPGYLACYRRTLELSWGYLSTEARCALRINNLEAYIDSRVSESAIMGARAAVAYGEGALGREYLRRAVSLRAGCIASIPFWKSFTVCMTPGLGRRYMQRRLAVTPQERTGALAFVTQDAKSNE